VQFEGRRRSSRMLDMTPLIDAVFLLLVFFMLTSHFVKEERIAVDLPQTNGGDPLLEERQITVVLARDGGLWVANEQVALEQLSARLQSLIGERRDITVQLRGDQAAALGAAVAVLEAAHKAGAVSVDIVTEGR